jgi:hypothetical protein
MVGLLAVPLQFCGTEADAATEGGPRSWAPIQLLPILPSIPNNLATIMSWPAPFVRVFPLCRTKSSSTSSVYLPFITRRRRSSPTRLEVSRGRCGQMSMPGRLGDTNAAAELPASELSQLFEQRLHFGLSCCAEAAQPLAERLREQGERADHDLSTLRRQRELWRRRSALSILHFTSLAASCGFTYTVTLGFGINNASASAAGFVCRGKEHRR